MPLGILQNHRRKRNLKGRARKSTKSYVVRRDQNGSNVAIVSDFELRDILSLQRVHCDGFALWAISSMQGLDRPQRVRQPHGLLPPFHSLPPLNLPFSKFPSLLISQEPPLHDRHLIVSKDCRQSLSKIVMASPGSRRAAVGPR